LAHPEIFAWLAIESYAATVAPEYRGFSPADIVDKLDSYC